MTSTATRADSLHQIVDTPLPYIHITHVIIDDCDPYDPVEPPLRVALASSCHETNLAWG